MSRGHRPRPSHTERRKPEMRRWLTTMTLYLLAGVEIGAGSIVEAGSVVATSLPAGSYCAGSPARVVCSVAEYAQRIAEEAVGRPRYTAEAIAASLRRPATRNALREELGKGIILVD